MLKIPDYVNNLNLAVLKFAEYEMNKTDNKVITRVLEASRRKLLDTGTRNRLVHVNRANQRANCLNVINEKTDEIYNLLRVNAKRMRFKAMGKDKTDESQDILLASLDSDIATASDRLTDNFIETPLGPDALARRLLRLSGDAKTAEEEQGLNILYLAMGFLRWKESPSSDKQRESPLVLLPVQLMRNEKTSTFDIKCRDDDITSNLPLQERLKQDFGILLPDFEDLEDEPPSHYFEKVSEAISGQADWSIDADGMQLGFFSFAKLLMHRDLDPSNWPADAFTENPLLGGLLSEGFPEHKPLFGPEDKLDDILDPAEIIQVIDADASQTKVIEEVRKGASLVVQGPPGTGKSQTITNIIAAAAHDGKSVLFVAEKMAALSVVHHRLVHTGLRDICLELHSRTANKKALAQELDRTLKASAKVLPPVSGPAQLRETRDKLNQISDLLHKPIAGKSDTPFQSISEIIGFIGASAPPPSIPLKGLEKLDQAQRARSLSAIDEVVIALDRSGPPESHPFRGVKDLDLQPTDLSRLEDELKNAITAIDDLIKEAGAIANTAELAEVRSFDTMLALCEGLKILSAAPAEVNALASILFKHAREARLGEALHAGLSWIGAKQKISYKFIDAAWDANVSLLRGAVVKGQASWFSRLFGGYRQASSELASLLSKELPKPPAERLQCIDDLLHVQALRRTFDDEELWLKSILGAAWRGEKTDFGSLISVANWLTNIQHSKIFPTLEQLNSARKEISKPSVISAELLKNVGRAKKLCSLPISRLSLDLSPFLLGVSLDDADLPKLRDAFQKMASDVARYSDWANLTRSISLSKKHNAGSIVDAIQQGHLEPSKARTEFSYACAEANWTLARQTRTELNSLQNIARHELVTVFKDLEKDKIETAKTLILARHFDQMPRGTMGEMGFIRGEIGRKRGHKPIRVVIKKAGQMVQRIKPVMLMSPISVAQFLPPGSVTFDLLVIDEASQIRPEDSLGVIARARQIVVVGDQKQLPPTSFFDRLVDDVEDNEDEEDGVPAGADVAHMESILSLCEARGLRQRMLEWHYRSRDPSLISVSNAEFYGDSLVLPPSPLQLDPDYGLKFQKVPGVYARGGTGIGRQGTNRIEAEAVVQAMADHAKKWPDLSLGVVTFSKAQANMLTEVLELHRRRDTVLDAFLREGKSEDVFVKNIENVQGDERDVIMISVGYGPQKPNGRLTFMTFGPISGEGGERRLNVLFSRARIRCEVFASFDPGDIDPARATRDGPRVLKRFLDFAKTGIIEPKTLTTHGADSPFEEDVAQIVRSLGYMADPQVGTAGFRIDIGVRHPERPGQYLMAVECDGATYHSAIWARERDRLRQGVLENLGWRFHRIWSTDWFHNRAQEIQKLKAALEDARMSSINGIQVGGANAGIEAAVPQTDITKEPDVIEIERLVMKASPYVRSDYAVESTLQPHDVPLYKLSDLVRKIVEVEGPIHKDEVTRRVASAFGLARAGSRIAKSTHHAIQSITRGKKDVQMKNSFVYTNQQLENPPVRDRSEESGSILKAEYLSPLEISTAAAQIVKESGEMSPEEMTKAVGRLLGYQRVGPDLHDVIFRNLTN